MPLQNIRTGSEGRAQDARPSTAWLRLEFPGVARPVILPRDGGLLAALLRCLKGWSPGISAWWPPDPGETVSPVLSLAEQQSDGTYRVSSSYTDAPLDGLPEASAVCALIADLAQAATEAEGRGGEIGLHCGAFEIAGRLVVLTGAHRAGKSTLIARLTAEPDLRVFCDDVLALSPMGYGKAPRGRALGIAPRLRLPLPDMVTEAFGNHVALNLGPADDRYGYILPDTLAPHGRSAPLSAIVVLDRRMKACKARFHAMAAEDALRLLVQRSISGYADAATAIATVDRVLCALPVLRLVYYDLEDAVALLRRAFGGETILPEDLPIGAPLALDLAPADSSPLAPVAPDTVWRRVAGIGLRKVGQSAFLWWPGDGMLWQLNPTGCAIWALLELPGSAQEVAEALAEIYPTVSPSRLEADCTLLLSHLAAQGFIEPA